MNVADTSDRNVAMNEDEAAARALDVLGGALRRFKAEASDMSRGFQVNQAVKAIRISRPLKLATHALNPAPSAAAT